MNNAVPSVGALRSGRLTLQVKKVKGKMHRREVMEVVEGGGIGKAATSLLAGRLPLQQGFAKKLGMRAWAWERV
jgi:hypothetical protein